MISLQHIKEEDLEWARNLRNENRVYFFNPSKISKQSHLKWFKEYDWKSKEFFVIFDGLQRVGTISVENKPDITMINNVIVDKPYRGRGIFPIVIGLLRLRYPTKFRLEVSANNNFAIYSYLRAGWTATKVTFEF